MSAAPMAVPNLVQIRPWGASGQMGEIIKKNYLYLFSGTHLQVGPVDGFSRLMAQTTRTADSRKGVPFLYVLFTNKIA